MEEEQFQAIRRSLRQIRWMVAAVFVLTVVTLVLLGGYHPPH